MHGIPMWHDECCIPARGRRGAPGHKEAGGMDFWVELAIREMLGDLNEEATELLEDAETLLVPADDADEEDE